MIKNILFLFSALCYLLSLTGCDAFVRKFTRKPKKDKLAQEELVLSPVEYDSIVDKADLYQQYFLYWRTWQEELSESLLTDSNHKKHLQCVNEALKNLQGLKGLLDGEKAGKIAVYIAELVKLKNAIEADIYNVNANINHSASERIRRNILRDFSYRKM